MAVRRIAALILGFLSFLVAPACIPDVPEKLLWDPAVLQHPAVTAAFQIVEKSLSDLFINTTRDGLSFAVVCSFKSTKASPLPQVNNC